MASSSSPRRFFETATPQAKPVPAAGTPAKRPVAEPPRLDPKAAARDLPPETGGYDGPEPTRFGDWEHKGRCTDF